MIAAFRRIRLGAAALAFALALAPVSAMAELYRVTSIAPGLSPFVVNTAIAKVVNTRVPGVEFQVRATGTATRHMLDAARGKVDFFFGAPTINWMMANRVGPFADLPEAPALEGQVGMILSYQMGPYHYVTRAGSGIETLDDLRGRRVFAGPPGGAATGVVLRTIEQATGITAQYMQLQAFGFDAAIQAFQDGKIDVIALPSNVPSPAIQQFALTQKIRLLDVDMDRVAVNALTGGTVNEIPSGAYGANQVNTAPVRSHGSLVNFSAGMHVPEDVVYRVTKGIWENLDEIQAAAQWMPATITRAAALAHVAGRLHPGAERYYREMGWTIPAPVAFDAGDPAGPAFAGGETR
ncbi:TAXI family TRAP transporter solute-binding subunit [Palleronia sediminis]|uniref:TAXI family TRAP transporter solute-binding subunit n=1 Tax=Palleronia sediminis TaxID=2547833 RepID=A0A4R6A5X4_9RHOB|nr:TAXI family TRAP transporter solute-binding subunit [Palleronia sediminis]TDL78077.1 TAXI family TRAP transporter solute-binding subunit [Palleronia sediminis]